MMISALGRRNKKVIWRPCAHVQCQFVLGSYVTLLLICPSLSVLQYRRSACSWAVFVSVSDRVCPVLSCSAGGQSVFMCVCVCV